MIEWAWPLVATVGIGVVAWLTDRHLRRPTFLAKQLTGLDGRVAALSLDFDRLKLRADKSKELEDRVGKLELERGLSE